MARKQPSTQELVSRKMDGLAKLVENLLLNNRNLKPTDDGRTQAYYLREYPQTQQYVNGPLKSQAEHILHAIEEVKEFVVDMAVTEKEQNLLEKHADELEDERPIPSPGGQ